ncbi:MAG: hypothetical protein WC734_00855 [Patescibacteria group bacterium]|jgi:hypothetical protein
MGSTLCYSFRTNKHLDLFRQNDVDVFVFGSLNSDLARFERKLVSEIPKRIIGLAHTKKATQFEAVAINTFGSNKKIARPGQDCYYLDTNNASGFQISKVPTTTFCNWTMYKIAEYISKHSNNIKFSFVHFNESDLDSIIKHIKS